MFFWACNGKNDAMTPNLKNNQQFVSFATKIFKKEVSPVGVACVSLFLKNTAKMTNMTP